MKIAVVGAGPCGLLFSRLAAEQGNHVLLLEEHQRLGLPRHCTGLVSSDVFDMYGVTRSEVPILSSFREGQAKMGNKTLTARFSQEVVAIDRVAFEEVLGRKAAEAGVSLQLGSRASASRSDGVQTEISFTSGGSRHVAFADLVVDCAGATSGMAGLQYLVRGRGPNRPQVFLEAEAPRELFYWIVPQSSEKYLVGTASSQNPAQKLDKFLSSREAAGYLEVEGKISTMAGTVVVGPSSPISSRFQGALAAGDAGGHVKYTSGGGLIFGALSAAALAESLERSNPRKLYLKWSRKRSMQLRAYLVLRQAYRFAPRHVLERLFSEEVQDYLLRNEVPYDDHVGFFKGHAFGLLAAVLS